MYGNESYYDASTVAAMESLSKIFGAIIIIGLIVGVITLIANWKIYTKAGKPGWASIIPIYNIYVLFEIAGMSGWMFLLLFIPFVNFIMIIMLYINLAKAFGKSSGFAVGLIFLNVIFMLILAFGDTKYIGNNTATK